MKHVSNLSQWHAVDAPLGYRDHCDTSRGKIGLLACLYLAEAFKYILCAACIYIAD